MFAVKPKLMEPIFLDLHIHTSDNPANLNENYDLLLLHQKIKEFNHDSNYLVSLTDHNTINTNVYLRSEGVLDNVIVGVELHIKYAPESRAYHCHAYFKDANNLETLNRLNEILDELYQNKSPSDHDDIPSIEDIIRKFDGFDFMLLPHGGQSHRTFDGSIPQGASFDHTLNKSIYYNQFEGFTARGNSGLERTLSYFERLNINEFVNLMTCTDNYNPNDYPHCKNADATGFVPTWMFSAPTFDGLRLSLSERSRLRYSLEKPVFEHNHIESVRLNNNSISIDAELSPGLNVVIGESSSGKTLFVDSLWRKITGNFENSDYSQFGITDMIVVNPSGSTPHFLNQNYIMSIVGENGGDLNKLPIVKDVFPGDQNLKLSVERGLIKLKQDLSELMSAVKEIESLTESLSHLPNLQNLIVTNSIRDNILKLLVPEQREIVNLNFSRELKDGYNEKLDEIEAKIKLNPFVENNSEAFDTIRELISKAHVSSDIEQRIRQVIEQEHENYETELMSTQRLDREKISNFSKILEIVTSYAVNYKKFKTVLSKISSYNTSCSTEKVESEGHKLFIKNDFKLNKEIVKEVINEHLKAPHRITDLDHLEPPTLFERNFAARPVVRNYDEFESKINSKFAGFNKKQYQIETSEGLNFNDLSPGWKTSILLDIILGYREDMAPIIIDQPEDNLATSYINSGLVKAIKNIKEHKQIILVSHNATIPMMADAQRVLLCENKGGKIHIKSGRLEDEIDGKTVVGHIADLTDGGKPSIKKRVKKYNLKNLN